MLSIDDLKGRVLVDYAGILHLEGHLLSIMIYIIFKSRGRSDFKTF